MTHKSNLGVTESLESLEQEVAGYFHSTSAPEDPWRESRLLARASQIPGRKRQLSLPVWLAALALSALAVVTAVVAWSDATPPAAPGMPIQGKVASNAADVLGDVAATSAPADVTHAERTATALVLLDDGQTGVVADNGEDGLALGEESLLEDEFMATASFSLLATLEAEVEPGDAEALVAYLMSDDSEEDDTW